MSLQEEIVARSSKIFRESYQMSIGELINLYNHIFISVYPYAFPGRPGSRNKNLISER